MAHRWFTTGKQCSWWGTRYQLDIHVVGHNRQQVPFGGGLTVAHHYVAVWVKALPTHPHRPSIPDQLIPRHRQSVPNQLISNS